MFDRGFQHDDAAAHSEQRAQGVPAETSRSNGGEAFALGILCDERCRAASDGFDEFVQNGLVMRFDRLCQHETSRFHGERGRLLQARRPDP